LEFDDEEIVGVFDLGTKVVEKKEYSKKESVSTGVETV
jgi:hypothetical protein